MENSKLQSAPSGLYILLIICILIPLAIVLVNSSNKKESKKEIPKNENIPQVGRENTVVNIGKTKTLYRFADYPNGKITRFLNCNAEWYPKGGKIKYKTSSGKILTDEPGSAHYNDLEPAGNFIFWADDQSAWGVEIWE